MPHAPFGNHPAKIGRYRAFWDRAPVRRPMVGFSLIGWFPLLEFAASQAWITRRYLPPEAIDPRAVVDDHVRMVAEGDAIDDDLIRGAGPMQVAVPFLPGILGCKIRVLPQNVMGEERNLSWEDALQARLDPHNPWYRAYMALADALVARAAGRFPVSHGAEIGPTDMHAVLRGHTQSIIDLVDEPGRSAELLWRLGEILRDFTEALWQRVPLFYGGYFDAQYALWSPEPIIRMQEDATAVYTPRLYRELVQPVDRMLARHFASAFMHLHSTSMFLLEAFLEIEELRCLEVNNDASGPPLAEMIPHFQRIQQAQRALVIRGAFEPDELRLLVDALDPRGLLLLIMVRDMGEVETLRPIVGL
ncbi:MAG: hypothetical protein JXA09_11705 [Anaerolineae bacterium]|nr:hypothetical protein [Anaerolineae bacterium]